MTQDENVLVFTDHFMYVQATVASSQMVQVMSKGQWNSFIAHYRLLTSIVSDQGRNFKNDLLCELAQVKKLRTTPYHLQGNGQCERFNSTLISMVGMLETRDKLHWRDFVPT